jgi:hypothetical protein
VQTLTGNYGAMNGDVSRIDGTLTNSVQPLVTELDEARKKMDLAQWFLKLDSGIAKTEIGALKDQASSLKSDWFTRMNSFDQTLQSFRHDQLMQSKQPGTRNIVARTLPLFKFGSERYLVTEQSYLLLQSIICSKSPLRPTPAGSPSIAASPSPASLLSVCKLDIKCECDEKIFDALKDLIGKPPLTEAQFIGKFDKNNELFKSWRPIILKYTRVL